jgi:hypothetical protein
VIGYGDEPFPDRAGDLAAGGSLPASLVALAILMVTELAFQADLFW